MQSFKLLVSPFYQLLYLGIVPILVMFVTRFDSKTILTNNFYLFILWMLISLGYGSFAESRWTYFWQAGVSFVGYIVLLIGISLLAEKISGKDGGDAWMAMLGLVNIFVVLMIISAIVNGIVSLFK